LVQRFEVGASQTSSRAETTRAQLQGRPAFGSNAAPEGAAAKVWFAKETTLGDPSLLTGDGNLIDLRYAVPYRVKSALDYAYNIAEPEALVRSTVLAALRGVVAAQPSTPRPVTKSSAPPAMPPRRCWTAIGLE
jgi:hypothetical protein